ncbi:ribose-5-phosphate isomerase RpiA [Arsenicitalea aurantiaca]|uniref:Ribose-5-phosphate isomerase A n=1 Tax=Arsenicitalea aurantiaca TaxID=1783274 RepID=A0A433XEG7_9HYPH|nr:ribose-5-phosphate isomerase RpiA [Arsenicitalea aurantiaca]RUT32483.1 ribose-5-phosphate isomerase RpiA [Arsenicitalea aurantiaca]
MSAQDEAKKTAGRLVINDFIEDGMVLGLGSGTTSHFFVRELGLRVAQGLRVTCTTTSRSTTAVAEEVGIAVTDIDQIDRIDLTIDGPDEIDRQFRMIKGGGACLLWEKIVAHASSRMITICDETKIVDRLGRFPLPVEVVQFGWTHSVRAIEEILGSHGVPTIRTSRRMRDGRPVITDSGHFIIDCHCEAIGDPEGLEIALNQIPGVVENGLFTRESAGMVVGRLDGTGYVKMR